MLEVLFPKAHTRYSSLPLLGSVLDDFATWLSEQGYKSSTLRVELRTVPRLDRSLRRRGAKHLADITPEMLDRCRAAARRRDHMEGGIVRSLHRYLEAKAILELSASPPLSSSPTTTQLAAYQAHLIDVRGLTYNTIRNHLMSVAAFLAHLDYDATPSTLITITASDVEAFIRRSGERLSRGSLQHVAGHLRGFLRFLATSGAGPVGLDTQVDTPRLYRFEQLPRSLPWEMVQRFLQSIDRTSTLGLRDYAMFSLIASYGLRVSEVAGLTLDQIHWRAGRILIRPPKTANALVLPLTDAAGTAVMDYLQEGRPHVAHREVFLRARAPIGPLGPTAVTMAFEKRAKWSQLDIPFFGAHCIRHSYAVHLLRQGTPLKTIGDLLGHRTAEATCMYLRLATEDLREVALSVPRVGGAHADEEVQP